jgi:hypothetical protein
MKWTLRSKLWVPTLAVVTVGLALVSVVSYWQSRSAIVNNITHEMEQICGTTVAHLDDWFADQRVNLEGWASLKVVQTALQDSFVGQAAVMIISSRFTCSTAAASWSPRPTPAR